MLSKIREQSSDARYDGAHALLLTAGAFIGLWLLTLWGNALPHNGPIPVILQSVVPWQGANVKPEPWEHQLFQIGLVLIPLSAALVWFACRKWLLGKRPNAATNIAAIIAICTAAVWLMTLKPTFDISSNWTAEPWMKLFPLSVGSLIAIALGILLLSRRWNVPSFTLPYPTTIEVIAVAIFVAFISYDPISLINGQQTSSSDDYWFIMPAFDILHGKHLLVGSESQYGLLIFYVLAGIFHFIGASIQSLRIVEMFAHAAYYGLLYVLVRSLCQTRRGALVAFLFILGGTIMRNELRFETYIEPSMTRLRNFWDVPVLLMFLMEQKTGNRRWFIAGCALAAVAFLWNTDIGLALTLTTAVYAFVQPFFQHLTVGERVIVTLKREAILAASIAIGCLFFSLFIHTVSSAWPNWPLNYEYVRLYMAGFGAMPAPVMGAYWAVLGVEMAALLTVGASWVLWKKFRYAPFLFAVATYGFLNFQYYLNRSFIANLWSVALPACLCGVMLFQAYRERSREEQTQDSLCSRSIRWPITIVAGAFLGINLWMVGAGVQAMAARRYVAVTPPPFDTTFATDMEAATHAIISRVPEGDAVAIVSPREALFLIAANRTSAFHVPMLETIFTVNNMNAILSTFAEEHRPFLFVEHNANRCPMCDAVVNALSPYYALQGTEGLLDVYASR